MIVQFQAPPELSQILKRRAGSAPPLPGGAERRCPENAAARRDLLRYYQIMDALREETESALGPELFRDLTEAARAGGGTLAVENLSPELGRVALGLSLSQVYAILYAAEGSP